MWLRTSLLVSALALTSLAGANIKEDADQPDVEIWLSEGVGRYGDLPGGSRWLGEDRHE